VGVPCVGQGVRGVDFAGAPGPGGCSRVCGHTGVAGWGGVWRGAGGLAVVGLEWGPSGALRVGRLLGPRPVWLRPAPWVGGGVAPVGTFHWAVPSAGRGVR